MGNYIEVKHPTDGRLLQVHCGVDCWDPVSVGDLLPWMPNFNYPGDWPDDIYDSDGPHGDEDDFVVIKGLRVHALIPPPKGPDGFPLGLYAPVSNRWDDGLTFHEKLRREYGIQDPPRDLWPDLAWEYREWERQKRKREEQERLAALEKKLGRKLTPRDRATDAVNEYTRVKMQEDGFLRMVMPPVREGYDAYPRRPEWEQLLQPLINAALSNWHWADRDVVKQYWQSHWSERKLVQQAIHRLGDRFLEEHAIPTRRVYVKGTWNEPAFRWDIEVTQYVPEKAQP